MAKGKLTLEPGAKLEAASLEAARVFQSVTVNEDIAPQQFFWEGDKYVLGNSQTSSDNTNSDKDSKEEHYENDWDIQSSVKRKRGMAGFNCQETTIYKMVFWALP